MRAIIKTECQNGKNYGGEKEMIECFDVVGKVRGSDGKATLRSIVTCRLYMGRSASASTVYCSLWVRGAGVYSAGHGQAGGYGYHKTSAALSEAIKSAGIELFGDQYQRDNSRARNNKPAHIGGCGADAMRGALVAIAKAAGGIGQLLVVEN